MIDSQTLVKVIKEGIEEAKGEKTAVIDLREVGEAIADFFIVVQGNSTTHIQSIAKSVSKFTTETLKDKPAASKRQITPVWIALDYGNVIVHVFHPEARAFYDVENLWNDAPTEWSE